MARGKIEKRGQRRRKIKPVILIVTEGSQTVKATNVQTFITAAGWNEELPLQNFHISGIKAKVNKAGIHSVVNENKFWEVIGSLKEAGAEGILIIPIEKMIL